ncbi:MAG: DUF262 domain-containing protein [Armatimonadetes bacterium]|nr:DUF262 domain-containing protein [Armatimonadota bacterium]
MQISAIISNIDQDNIALPEFQRGYVWNRDQVRGLMHSLYRKHPVGSLLVWVTKTTDARSRGDNPTPVGTVQLLLDGQQRITTLYGITKGKPPKFFDGNAQAFTGLHFNIETEEFKFYSQLEMRDNPRWIDVTKLMRDGVGEIIGALYSKEDLHPKMETYIARITALGMIKEIDLHIEQVVGEDKTVDVVVDIFNRVNSGGTKLSTGDLALAKICAQWPEARIEMKRCLDRWRDAGFHFRLEWLLRNVNAIVTGEALFSALKDTPASEIADGLKKAEKAVNVILNMISGRLGLDHDRVLGSKGSLPLLARYIAVRGGKVEGHRERDKLLFWYVHTLLWGRYAGSSETVLNQDLRLIESGNLDDLINGLRASRGDLRIDPVDFSGSSLGARFYPMLYMLTRVYGARDWDTGLELSENLLGKFSSLHVHHIFPKAQLYKRGYCRSDVNAVANFCFQTQDSNLGIGDRLPHEYFEEVERRNPGALASQWIPMDKELWRMDRYLDFLAARRELLATAANKFLESLLSGSMPEVSVGFEAVERTGKSVAGPPVVEDEERVIFDCVEWVANQGLPEGELLYELTDPQTGRQLAVLDLAWPDGLQKGLSKPVALLINEAPETEDAANKAGFHYFTNVEEFKNYVRREILAVEDI